MPDKKWQIYDPPYTSRTGKILKIEGIIVIIRDWVEEGWGSYCLMHRVSVWGDDYLLEIVMMVAKQWMQLMPLNCTFKMAKMANYVLYIFYNNSYKINDVILKIIEACAINE